MKQFILYITIANEIFPTVPNELLDLQTSDIRLFDIDQESGKEVISTAGEAIQKAEKVLVCIHTKDHTLDIDGLFPVFRRTQKNSLKCCLFQLGNHPHLEKLLRKNPPVTVTSHEDLVRRIITELETN